MSCEIAKVVYCLNYIRIVQSNNVEIIFKQTPCPPKGEMSDFRFDYPSAVATTGSTEKLHWHFKQVPIKVGGRQGYLVSKHHQDLAGVGHGKKRKYAEDLAPQAIWQPYSILENGAQLFFLLGVEATRL